MATNRVLLLFLYLLPIYLNAQQSDSLERAFCKALLYGYADRAFQLVEAGVPWDTECDYKRTQKKGLRQIKFIDKLTEDFTKTTAKTKTFTYSKSFPAVIIEGGSLSQIKELERMMQSDSDTLSPYAYSGWALYIAVKRSYEDRMNREEAAAITDYLLAKEPPLHGNGAITYWAVKADRVDILPKLLSLGAGLENEAGSYLQSPMELLYKKGERDLVLAFLHRGATVKVLMLDQALSKEDVAMQDTLMPHIKPEFYHDVLRKVSWRKAYAFLERQLQAGYGFENPEARRTNRFDIALREDDAKMLALLIKYTGPFAPTNPVNPAKLSAEMLKVLNINPLEQASPKQLSMAISEGDTSQVAMLLERGVDPNALYQRKPMLGYLYRAPKELRIPLGKQLLAAGADPNKEARLMEDVLRKFDQDLVQFFLEEGGNPFLGKKSYVFPYPENSVAEELIKGKNLEALALAATSQYFTQDVKDVFLLCACEHGDLEVVRFFVAQGADVNTWDEQAGPFDYTPLMVAARKDNLRLVKYLIEAGADKSIRNSAYDNYRAWDYWDNAYSKREGNRAAMEALLK